MASISALKMLGVGLSVFVLLKLLKPAVYLYALLKSQYRHPKYSLVPADEVPADVREYLLEGAEHVFALGFSIFGWTRYQSIEHSEHGDSYALMLLHEAEGIHAWLNTGSVGGGLRTNFIAEFDDGSRLETSHGESQILIGEFDDTEFVDTTRPEIDALWQCFLDRFFELKTSRSVVPRTPDERAASVQTWLASTIDKWVGRGAMQPAREPGRFEFTWRQALHLAHRIGPGLEKHAKFRALRAKLEPAVFPLSEQIRTYRKVREAAERRSTRFGISSVLIVSGLLFALSMWRVFDWRDIAGLVCVLVFHELGHYLAMRAFGYRDTSIFFIPFLGAAARGIKPEARIHEQLIVLLAGPTPGIVLGAILPLLFPAIRTQPQLRTLVDLLIGINLFNLLPIFPLDGGRIFQLIFSNARPFVEVGVRAVGAALLLALGIFSSDAVTIALSIVLGLSIPAAKRTADALRRIRALGPVPEQEEARLALLFTELRTNQPSLPPAKSYGVVLPLAQRLRNGELGKFGTLGWCAAYVGCIVAGFVALAVVSVGAQAFRTQRRAPTPIDCGALASLQSEIAPETGSLTMHCAIGDRRRASALVETIQEYSQLPVRGCLRAPWDEAGDRTAALLASESRARRTLHALVRERQRAASESADSASDEGPPTPALEAAVKRASEDYVQAHRSDPDFDVTAANLYLQVHPSSESATLEGSALEALLDRLGRRDQAACAEERDDFTVAIQNKRGVTLYGTRANVRDGIRGPAAFLCSQGCALTYGVRMDERLRHRRETVSSRR